MTRFLPRYWFLNIFLLKFIINLVGGTLFLERIGSKWEKKFEKMGKFAALAKRKTCAILFRKCFVLKYVCGRKEKKKLKKMR